ncbi:MAG: MmcQ/YjbR family DNA-binding protein [Rhodospirillaceae bacterium]|nr:MmcQ/YjbR family DNA-binding protein [Rhodospirillaceae bacterium]
MVTAKSKTSAARERVLARLRKICAALPDVVEKPSFGNPAFRAGTRPFVVLDRYKRTDCIFIYVDPGRREELLANDAFFKAPYDPREKALCRTLEKIDWREMQALIGESYRLVRPVKKRLRTMS